MNSIQTKTTLLTVCAIVVTMLVATLMGVVAIRDIGKENSQQLLMSLCESGEKNLDSYFESVEQAVEMVSAYVEADLEGMTDAEQLPDHLDRVKEIYPVEIKMTGSPEPAWPPQTSSWTKTRRKNEAQERSCACEKKRHGCAAA